MRTHILALFFRRSATFFFLARLSVHQLSRTTPMPDAILKGEIVDEATEVAEATLIKQKVMGAECKKSDESVKVCASC